MKKFLIIGLFSLIVLPAYSSCDITTGMCRADVSAQDTLNERLLPNHLDELQNPITLNVKEAPSDIRYNLQSPVNNNVNSNDPYDAGCQFGACVGRPPINTNEF